LYSNGDTGGGYTFILDSNTGQVCELNLGGWASRVHWSPNGRYLAITRFQGSRSTDSSDLAILDALTGNLYTMRVTPQEIEGRHYVNDIAWAPDNRHVLVIGSIFPFQGTGQDDSRGLYLVDFISGQSDYLLPTYKFSSSNLAWSHDGSKLLVRCPTMEEDRVCFISVQRIEQ
jgi:Tol biopolymer transport system component